MSGTAHPSPPPLIVFTDLDGTLLDHADYSFDPARPALEKLHEINAALVLASSKTGAEMARLAAALPAPPAALIVENGAGVLWPGAAAQSAAAPTHPALRKALAALPETLRRNFHGFSDWGPAGIAAQTGLPAAEAALAAQRQFSEPGLWQGDEAGLAAFLAALAEQGITARQGGRYLTLSFGADKADRLAEVAARLAPKAATLALGDAPNDAAMLQAAGQGVIIANPHGSPLPPLPGEASGRIRRSTLPGPAGWNHAVLETIDALGLCPARQTSPST